APLFISNSPRTQRVKSDLEAGLSVRQISADRGVSKSWVGNLRLRLNNLSVQARPGRPRKLTEHDRRQIVRSILTGRHQTAASVHRELLRNGNARCSVTTVRRALKASGLRARVTKKKPALTKAHKRARLEWARAHRNWTASDWNKVVFSDETKINRFGSDGRKWVWAVKGSPLTEREVTPTYKFGGGGVMVWGCITSSSVGGMAFIQGIMDSKKYTDILQDRLLPTLDALDLLPQAVPQQQYIFQHDNDPKHKSRHTKAWLAHLEISVLDWPAQSPDLNPIEHLWRRLKEQLKGYRTPAANLDQLRDRILEQWALIPQDYIEKLYASMPDRIRAVIRARGGPTRY
ncbi:hypothetical protein A4X03_0g9611, partial [Tilletia caries]